VGDQQFTRKLTAILAADMAGYSRLMGADEEGTLRRLGECRRNFIDPKVAEYRGRIVKTAGDGLLIEYSSVVDAVRCAVDIQRAMATFNRALPAGRRMDFRIGINLGDVVALEEDIYGDGVNVAARLEGLADPGGICISKPVLDQVQDKLDLAVEDLGEKQVKNIARPIRVLRILVDGQGRRPPSLAASRSKLGAIPKSWPMLAAALIFAGLAAYALWQHASRKVAPGLPPGGPSIALLPFSNLSGEESLNALAEGTVEDIATQLGQVPGLTVLARAAATKFAGTAVDIEKAGRALGVRYLLDGSLRKIDDQVRLSVQLLEVSTGTELWGARYDLALANIAKAEDAATDELTTRLLLRMHNHDLQLAKGTSASALGPYGFYLLGKEALARADLRGIEVASRMFDSALAGNSAYAPALAGKALVALREFIIGRSDTGRDAALERLFGLAQIALKAGPGSADAEEVVAYVYVYRHQYSQAISLLQSTIAGSADDSGLREALGDAYIFAGDPAAGLATLAELMRLDPFHDQAVYSIIGRGDIVANRGQDALANAELCMARTPEFRPCLDVATVAFEEAGRRPSAAESLARAKALDPSLSLASLPGILPFKRASDLQRFEESLAAAGLR